MARASKFWCWVSPRAQRVIGIVLPFMAIYISIGSILFPEWWFIFVYRKGFLQSGQWIAFVNVFSIAPITASVVTVAIIIAVILLFLFRSIVLRTIDRHKLLLWSVSFMFIVVSITSIYHTQKKTFMLWDTLVNSAQLIMKNPQPKMPPLTVPIFFHFLDGTAIDELHNQIQPEIIEKSRSARSTNKLGVSGQATVGPLGIAGEGSSESSLTTEFSRIKLANTRKALELINYCIYTDNVVCFTSYSDWNLRHFRQILTQNYGALFSKAGDPDYTRLSKVKLVDLERINVEAFKKSFIDEMRGIRGFVLLNSKHVYYDALSCQLIVVSDLSAEDQVVKFIVKLPENQRLSDVDFRVLDVRIFGVVVKGLDIENCIHVRPIAIFQ